MFIENEMPHVSNTCLDVFSSKVYCSKLSSQYP